MMFILGVIVEILISFGALWWVLNDPENWGPRF